MTGDGLLAEFESRQYLGGPGFVLFEVSEMLRGDLCDDAKPFATIQEDVGVAAEAVFAEGIDGSNLDGGAGVWGLAFCDGNERWRGHFKSFAADAPDFGGHELVIGLLDFGDFFFFGMLQCLPPVEGVYVDYCTGKWL